MPSCHASCGDDEDVKVASPEDNSETPVDTTHSQPTDSISSDSIPTDSVYSQPADSIAEIIGSWYMTETLVEQFYKFAAIMAKMSYNESKDIY